MTSASSRSPLDRRTRSDVGALHDVVVGQDVAVGAVDDPRAERRPVATARRASAAEHVDGHHRRGHGLRHGRDDLGTHRRSRWSGAEIGTVGAAAPSCAAGAARGGQVPITAPSRPANSASSRAAPAAASAAPARRPCRWCRVGAPNRPASPGRPRPRPRRRWRLRVARDRLGRDWEDRAGRAAAFPPGPATDPGAGEAAGTAGAGPRRARGGATPRGRSSRALLRGRARLFTVAPASGHRWPQPSADAADTAGQAPKHAGRRVVGQTGHDGQQFIDGCIGDGGEGAVLATPDDPTGFGAGQPPDRPAARHGISVAPSSAAGDIRPCCSKTDRVYSPSLYTRCMVGTLASGRSNPRCST